ncbi:protein yellow-like isoform X1 [Myzus persicae]|uniref:protein yellow-like isoform X1 n=1 Tax=Myzus persicae TaxID=13164 RepID=UPI000B93661A|nr:protein yellow-like isoform X1 [Myzus persicae]
MARIALAILILGCCTCAVWSVNDRLREVYSWKQMDFAFPDQRTRQAAIASGEYVQANNLPLGLEVWRDKLFITVPRWKSGVASTLNYVSLGSGPNHNRSPRLVPYPNYKMNRLPATGQPTTDHLINTYRISVDKCDRLWAIDMGISNGTKLGQPQLFIFDLNTDQVVRQFVITQNLLRLDGNTWFPGVLADTDSSSCNRAFAYIPDIGGGLLVYDYYQNTVRRIEHHYFYFDPLATVFHIGGVRVEWPDGLFGLGLSERHRNGYRTLYFQSMSSTRMFSVDTSVLQSNTSGTNTFEEYRHLGHRVAGMQAGPMTADEVTGTVFYSLVNQDAIGCWNPKQHDHLSPETSAVLAQDSETLEFPGDIKVDLDSNLWVLSDRMPRFRFQVLNFDPEDVNYRVLRATVSDAIRGTVCESPRTLTRPPSGPNNPSRPRPISTSTSGSGWNTPSHRMKDFD